MAGEENANYTSDQSTGPGSPPTLTHGLLLKHAEAMFSFFAVFFLFLKFFYRFVFNNTDS